MMVSFEDNFLVVRANPMKGLDQKKKRDSKAHRPPLWPSEANGKIVAVFGDVGSIPKWLCQEKSLKTEQAMRSTGLN